jgi:hypothetical protein
MSKPEWRRDHDAVFKTDEDGWVVEVEGEFDEDERDSDRDFNSLGQQLANSGVDQNDSWDLREFDSWRRIEMSNQLQGWFLRYIADSEEEGVPATVEDFGLWLSLGGHK